MATESHELELTAGVMRSRKVAFLHIPKTGGSSLAQLLKDTETDQRVIYPGVADFEYKSDKDLEKWMHWLYFLDPSGNPDLTPERCSKISTVIGHFGFEMIRFFGSSFVYVTVLRDPVPRVLSQLGHMKRQNNEHGSFEDIYHRHLKMGNVFLDNLQTRFLSSSWKDLPTLIGDTSEVDGACLERAFKALSMVDVVGVTERFSEILPLIEEKTGRKLGTVIYLNSGEYDATQSRDLCEEIRYRNSLDMALYESALRRCDELTAQSV